MAAVIIAAAVLLRPVDSGAHPMGNFSISHYSAIRLWPDTIELRYLLDLAEIPTFQELQDNGIAADSSPAGLRPYLIRRVEVLARGLVVELNGQHLPLSSGEPELLFTPGAGGLPTMKIGTSYRTSIAQWLRPGSNTITYRDDNFPQRAGWKEVIALGGPGVTLTESSVPARDRSRALTDYGTESQRSAVPGPAPRDRRQCRRMTTSRR